MPANAACANTLPRPSEAVCARLICQVTWCDAVGTVTATPGSLALPGLGERDPRPDVTFGMQFVKCCGRRFRECSANCCTATVCAIRF